MRLISTILSNGYVVLALALLTFGVAIAVSDAQARSHHRHLRHAHHHSHARHHHHHLHNGRHHGYVRHHVQPAGADRADTPSRFNFSFFTARPGNWGIGGFADSVVSEARSQLGNGAVYGRSTLWCARFVNYVLVHTGHASTHSDAAASFADYGKPVDGPKVGAIAVMHRRGGGHVGIVTGVTKDGDPVIISGNHNHKVREAVYPRRRIYAFRVPSK